MLPCLSRAEIYKWVDKEGITHFSDREQLGAEKVSLPPVQTYSAPKKETVVKTEVSNTVANKDEQPSVSVNYQLSITAPYDKDTFRSELGEVTVEVDLSPELQDGHKIRILVDNMAKAEEASLKFILQGIERGEHTLQAQLISSSGQTVASSGKITFYMQRPRVIKPRAKPV